MQYIYEFNQEKLLNITDNNITMNDVVILHYIVNAICSPKMQRKYENDKLYVWIDHSHLLESLPILGFSKNRLSTVIKKLKDLELLETLNIANHKNKGSKSFITVTNKLLDCIAEKTHKMISEQKDHFVKIQTEKRPLCKNTNSNNKLDNNKLLLNNKLFNNSNFLGSRDKNKTKKMTYQDCIVLINQYTDDLELRKVLIDYFNLRLSMKDKPMRLMQWEYVLDKLTESLEKSSNDVTATDIVKYSIERGYASFYPMNKKQYTDKQRFEPGNLSCKQMSKEDREEAYRQAKAREERGETGFF